MTATEHPRFRLLTSGKVQQAHPDGSAAEFDPTDWAEYAGPGGLVRACKIPRTFAVAGDICSDGWLVRSDRGLAAISTPTFSREYQLVPTLASIAAAVD